LKLKARQRHISLDTAADIDVPLDSQPTFFSSIEDDNILEQLPDNSSDDHPILEPLTLPEQPIIKTYLSSLIDRIESEIKQFTNLFHVSKQNKM
jgi:hypothetical protein